MRDIVEMLVSATDEELDGAHSLLGDRVLEVLRQRNASSHRLREEWEPLDSRHLFETARDVIGRPRSVAPMSPDAGWNALAHGDLTQVSVIAAALLAQAANTSGQHWNYGNLLHDGHILAGYVRLREGDLDVAGRELLAAAQTPGSPTLDTFGPDLSLAWELLRVGRQQAALEYFIGVARFWSPSPPLPTATRDT